MSWCSAEENEKERKGEQSKMIDLQRGFTSQNQNQYLKSPTAWGASKQEFRFCLLPYHCLLIFNLQCRIFRVDVNTSTQ